MKKEELQAIFDSESSVDEKIAQIFALNGKDVNKAKEVSTQSATELENLKLQLQEKQSVIDGMKDYEELKQFKEDTVANQDKQEKLKFLEAQGFKHADLFMDKIDWSKATKGENGFEGLDGTIAQMKEQYKDMFPQMQTPQATQQTTQTELDGVTAQFMRNNPDIKL